MNIEDLGGEEGEDNNGNEKIVDTKVTNDNVATTSASGSGAKNAKRPAHHRPHHKSTAKSGGGGCPTSAAGSGSARSNNKKGGDSDNHGGGGGRKGHHKPGGRKGVCAPLGLTRVEEAEGGLGRLEEDINTEIESMDDSMCQVSLYSALQKNWQTEKKTKKQVHFIGSLCTSVLWCTLEALKWKMYYWFL